MAQVVVTAIGPDRPGIVARVTRVLADHGANVADSRMGLLNGRFTMMLVVDAQHPDAIATDLRIAAGELGLDALHVELLGDARPAAAPTHVVSVYGADHPGIVAAVTGALAAAGANVTDLRTQLAGELYVMTIEVSGGDDVDAALREVAAEQGVDVTVRALDDDLL